jgi:ABC-type sugar transport system ATPase subunit
MGSETALEIEHVSKAFYGSQALKDVSLTILKGEVHIVCGENGAGKSTLMKIISGMYTMDSGSITLFDEPYAAEKPADAEKRGVVTIYQESNLCPTISVAENIFLHREPGKFFVDGKTLHAEAGKYLDRIGCNVSEREKVKNLSTANVQLVQIAKALSHDAKVLIMDEPCSSISEEDTARLFALINDLKKEGLSVIYIDHRIDNFKLIGDRISVLRDGQLIETAPLESLNKDDIVRMMVGRSISGIFRKTNAPKDENVFEIKHYTNKKIKDISFSVRRGEVFGLAGLVGAGRSEIVRAIFGIDAVDPCAETYIGGRPVKNANPGDAIRNKIAFVPEDRKVMGFVPGRSIPFNLALASVSSLGKYFFVDNALTVRKAKEQTDSLQIKALRENVNVRELSGGNQQKVVIGKWLMRDDTELILMDEPTRGIDVGVKMEIYKLIDTITGNGKSVILITSEMVELIGMCDRIAAIKEGRITRIFERDEFSQELIMKECV